MRVPGQYLFNWAEGDWISSDRVPLTRGKFTTKPVVLLVHGFTESLDSMSKLAERLSTYGYECFGYQYPSHQGIAFAGQRLRGLLLNQEWDWAAIGTLDKPPIVIVAHSMGGLVSRAILLGANVVQAIDIARLIRGIISLGTPHDGTLTSVTYTQRLMKAILRRAEWAAKTPLRRSTSRGSNAVTARELAKQDDGKVIATLNAPATRSFPTISISGGWEYRYAERDFFKVIVQAIENLIVKTQLPTPHDGLVPEISSDITRVLAKRSEAVKHLGKSGYANWAEINHSDLVVDQLVFGAVNDGLSRLP